MKVTVKVERAGLISVRCHQPLICIRLHFALHPAVTSLRLSQSTQTSWSCMFYRQNHSIIIGGAPTIQKVHQRSEQRSRTRTLLARVTCLVSQPATVAYSRTHFHETKTNGAGCLRSSLIFKLNLSISLDILFSHHWILKWHRNPAVFARKWTGRKPKFGTAAYAKNPSTTYAGPCS